MSRIQTTFDKLKQHKRKALIPFFTAGDPDPKLTVPLLHALVEAGADVIELGVPFSDPMADGPTIQRASERALKHHVSLHHVLDMVAEFRRSNTGTPIVLMGYGNPIEAMGWETFAKRCAEVGVDGVLTVDFPPEEGHEAFAHLEKHGIDPIFLLAPTSTDARVARVAKQARGYVYYVSLKGVTGRGESGSVRHRRKDSAAAQAHQAAHRRGFRHPRCGDRAGGGEAVRWRGGGQPHRAGNRKFDRAKCRCQREQAG